MTDFDRRSLLRTVLLGAGLGTAGRLPFVDRSGESASRQLIRPVENPTQLTFDGSGWTALTSGPAERTPALTRAWFRSMVRCGRRTIFVSGTGSDVNSGTETAPLREINTAISHAEPGDLILVDSGEYGYTEVQNFHGSADRWLGIMTRGPSVTARIHVPAPTDNFVNIVSSSFVGLYGFFVQGEQSNRNTNCSGISVHGNSHHLAIWSNQISDFPGGGINCFDVDGSHDLMDISFNTVHGTSKYSPNNTSGISVFASRDLTGGETFADGFGYHLVGNYIYDVECTVPFTPGGFEVVTDGNGISLDRITAEHHYGKPILTADNIITGCGGRGILAHQTGSVVMTRNTSIGNLRTQSPAISGGAELEGTTDHTVQMIDNVIFPINTPATVDSRSTFLGNTFLAGGGPVPLTNRDERGLGFGYFAGPVSEAALRAPTARGTFSPRWR